MALDDRPDDASVAPRASAPAMSAPRAVKIAIAALVAVLMAGAIWLFSVRGEALLIDLYAAGSRLLCL
jgi:hypothetical protein